MQATPTARTIRSFANTCWAAHDDSILEERCQRELSGAGQFEGRYLGRALFESRAQVSAGSDRARRPRGIVLCRQSGPPMALAPSKAPSPLD